MRPHYHCRACELTARSTMYSASSELVCVAHNPFLQLFRSRSTANELCGQATEHSCSHATMSSNGAAALLTVPGHQAASAMSAAAAAELVEARGAARDGQRIASHSSLRLLHGVHCQLCFAGKTMY